MANREFSEILEQVEAGRAANLYRTVDGKKYARQFVPKERLILLGGGHISQPLCKIAAILDFDVVVVDDRPSFANRRRFPEAAQVICDSFDKAIEKIAIRPTDYVCVITRGHRWDGLCLRQILPGVMPYYFGMIGSRRRVSGLLELLREEGFDADRLASICAPIGLPIHAITPQEIAISICAQLVEYRRGGQKKDGVDPVSHEFLDQKNVDLDMLRFLANDTEPKALLLVLESTGSTPVKAGAIMAVDYIGKGYGTIGGGCSEAAVMGRARNMIGTGESCVVKVDMTNDVAAQEGMVCGGTMQVLVEDVPVAGKGEQSE